MKRLLRILLLSIAVLCLLSVTAFAENAASDFEYHIVGPWVRIDKYVGSAEEVVIPDTIEGKPVGIIGSSAFEGNWHILSVKMPEKLIIVEDKAFAGCNSLMVVVFTGGRLSRVEDDAFSGVEADIMSLPRSTSRALPKEGTNVSWHGGNFKKVVAVYNHECQDKFPLNDGRCDICGKEMETVNLGSNPATRAQFCPAIAKAAARTTAVATRVLITTTVVIRNILKLF